MVLDKISGPEDLKSASLQELQQICNALRQRIIEVVAKNEGHLGASLGVVELTVALHKVFHSQKTKLFGMSDTKPMGIKF